MATDSCNVLVISLAVHIVIEYLLKELALTFVSAGNCNVQEKGKSQTAFKWYVSVGGGESCKVPQCRHGAGARDTVQGAET